MTNTKLVTDPVIEEHNRQVADMHSEEAKFLARFNDIEAFLESAKIVVQYYFEQQQEIKDY